MKNLTLTVCAAVLLAGCPSQPVDENGDPLYRKTRERLVYPDGQVEWCTLTFNKDDTSEPVLVDHCVAEENEGQDPRPNKGL